MNPVRLTEHEALGLWKLSYCQPLETSSPLCRLHYVFAQDLQRLSIRSSESLASVRQAIIPTRTSFSGNVQSISSKQRFIINCIDVPGDSDGKESACNARDPGLITGLGRYPGEGNAIHSSILAWRIPWTEKPGRLQFMVSQRVSHYWVTNTPSEGVERWE